MNCMDHHLEDVSNIFSIFHAHFSEGVWFGILKRSRKKHLFRLRASGGLWWTLERSSWGWSSVSDKTCFTRSVFLSVLFGSFWETTKFRRLWSFSEDSGVSASGGFKHLLLEILTQRKFDLHLKRDEGRLSWSWSHKLKLYLHWGNSLNSCRPESVEMVL